MAGHADQDHAGRARADLHRPGWTTMPLSDIQGSTAEAMLAMAAAAGRHAMGQLMAAEVSALVGPKGKHDHGRRHVRHGTEQGSVLLAGRRLQIRRPRVRAPGLRAEIPLATYDLFTRHDVLSRAVLEQMLARLSAGDRRAVPAPVRLHPSAAGPAPGTSAAIERALIAATEAELGQALASDLSGEELTAVVPVLVRFAGRPCLAVIGVRSDEVIRPLLLVRYQPQAAGDHAARAAPVPMPRRPS